MTHEPECPRSWTSILSGKPLYDDVFEGFECGYCLIATRAYKRGREDAAEAVRLEFLNEPVSAARLMAAASGNALHREAEASTRLDGQTIAIEEKHGRDI